LIVINFHLMKAYAYPHFTPVPLKLQCRNPHLTLSFLRRVEAGNELHICIVNTDQQKRTAI
jgi:hypothetical protein